MPEWPLSPACSAAGPVMPPACHVLMPLGTGQSFSFGVIAVLNSLAAFSLYHPEPSQISQGGIAEWFWYSMWEGWAESKGLSGSGYTAVTSGRGSWGVG